MRAIETLQLSDNEITHFRENHYGFINLESAEISKLFLQQLYHFYSNRIFSIHYVLDEIRYLEGITKATRTKKRRRI